MERRRSSGWRRGVAARAGRASKIRDAVSPASRGASSNFVSTRPLAAAGRRRALRLERRRAAGAPGAAVVPLEHRLSDDDEEARDVPRRHRPGAPSPRRLAMRLGSISPRGAANDAAGNGCCTLALVGCVANARARSESFAAKLLARNVVAVDDGIAGVAGITLNQHRSRAARPTPRA